MTATESVWDYPRPPRLEASPALIEVHFADTTVASSQSAFRVLETSHPPTWYLPANDVRTDLLEPATGRSVCEWKGEARYWTLRVAGRIAERACWSYPEPTQAFAAIAGYVCFYPSRVDACFVDGERVQAQAGDFYGGWVTSNLRGPFKGGPGTLGW